MRNSRPPPRLQRRPPPIQIPPPPPPPEFLPPDVPLHGYVFSCSNETMQACIDHGIFGLEYQYRESVARIRPNMYLFLFNIDTKLLHGVYRATSNGDLNIDASFCPDPLHPDRSRFPAQVRFARWPTWPSPCPPIMTVLLRPLIDYVDPITYLRELDEARVHNTMLAISRLEIYFFALADWMNGGAEPQVIVFN